MKKIILILTIYLFGSLPSFSQTVSHTIFNEILFYDGYAAIVSLAVPDGVIRHRNDLYAKKITNEQLASFGNNITINVTVKAACDNYDRIGNVNLAFVPKGDTSYNTNEAQKIEVGRFITPFMNKNVQPTQVSYTYIANNLDRIFKDSAITATYDIWAELEIFGVPYSANTEVSGCTGRNDVFYGTLEFVSSGTSANQNPETFFLPLSFKADFNNYQQNATDNLGLTVKTITFDIEERIYGAQFYLITSNHGANQGGEEYVRRWHYVHFNNTKIFEYIPGGLSCEPFRVYNTQGNGIYGPTPRSTEAWASWSNWCPGDVIPVRVVNLGTLEAGTYNFVISVPAAQFVGNQGNFPLSLYLQGSYSSTITGIADINNNPIFKVYPNPATDIVKIESSADVKEVGLFNTLGKKIVHSTENQLNLSDLQSGIYLMQIEFKNGTQAVQRILKK